VPGLVGAQDVHGTKEDGFSVRPGEGARESSNHGQAESNCRENVVGGDIGRGSGPHPATVLNKTRQGDGGQT